jgi:tetratricopeptide (TPR) repeat protein
MKRVLRPHGTYTSDSLQDLERKIEFYSSQPHLGDLSTGDVVVEHIYDVLSKSNNKEQIQIESIDGISTRLELNHDWSGVLNEIELSLLLSAYYVERGPDAFESIRHRQDPERLPDVEPDKFPEHLADTLTEHAEANEEENVLAASLYEHAAEIYDEIGADEQATTATVQSYIGTGFQAMQDDEYSTAREAFRNAAQESTDSPDLGGLFIFAANQEATAIREQFQHDGDLESALDHIESLIELINNHPSPTIHINEDAPLDDVTDTKDYLTKKDEATDTKQREVPIPDDERDDETVENVEREYTKVKRKQRDQRFRDRVIQVYDDTCAACGSQRRTPDGRPEVEAAHIHPAGDKGPDKIKNGIALCKLHHWAFDNGWIAVDDNYSIIIRDAPHVNGYNEFSELEGTNLVLPNDDDLHPKQEFFEYHRKEHGFEG